MVPCLDTWAINSSSVFVAQITELCSATRCEVDNKVSLIVERSLKGDPAQQLHSACRRDPEPRA